MALQGAAIGRRALKVSPGDTGALIRGYTEPGDAKLASKGRSMRAMFNDSRDPFMCASTPRSTTHRFPRAWGAALTLALAMATAPAHAHGPSNDLSAASGLSLSVPVAISVAPSAVLVSGAAFTLVAIETLAEGTVWVMERASDGVRFSVRFGKDVAVGASVVTGAVVVSTVVAAGCVLSAAGEAVAFIPNEIGRALIHDERITR
jgi:hypothetical protein